MNSDEITKTIVVINGQEYVQFLDQPATPTPIQSPTPAPTVNRFSLDQLNTLLATAQAAQEALIAQQATDLAAFEANQAAALEKVNATIADIQDSISKLTS